MEDSDLPVLSHYSKQSSIWGERQTEGCGLVLGGGVCEMDEKLLIKFKFFKCDLRMKSLYVYDDCIFPGPLESVCVCVCVCVGGGGGG